MKVSLRDQCQSLLARVTAQCSKDQTHSFTSPSIYDTAWLSMLRKPTCTTGWLFPECFDFILQNQMPDGAWQSYRSEADGILNTAAALLSLRKHLRGDANNRDWELRSRQAESALKVLLNHWDLASTDQVGFEILVIKQLSLLEDEGLVLDFPGLETLRGLRDSKLEKLPISYDLPINILQVYEAPSTLHHSLEAFIGVVDFDRLKRWRNEDGSMCGSISSTVAYLMHSSTWDQEAEGYLRNVLEHGTEKKDGGVPCAWPTTVFEASWVGRFIRLAIPVLKECPKLNDTNQVVATLAEAGAPVNEMLSSGIGDFLGKALASRNGIIGFCPSVLPDADDTAKTIIALRSLGKAIDVEPLLKAFDSGNHFKTYQGERNPSFSANCNILACLMTVEDPTPYAAHIAKAASFLCGQVLCGQVKDKWHSHELYWMMLLSQTFVRLDQRTHEKGSALRNEIFTRAPHLRQQIPIISFQILIRILNSQELDGSWGDICEVTAYAILALSSIAQLPWVQQLQDDEIMPSINRGKSYLELHREQWTEGHHLWIEKVTFASNILSETYCLAAALVPANLSHQPPLSHEFLLPTSIESGIQGAMRLISQAPLFAETRTHVLKATEPLAAYVLWSMQHQQLEIFPQSDNEKTSRKYEVFTSAIWVACSAMHGSGISTSVLCEMVTFSGIMFQVDQYMEDVVERELGKHLPAVSALIKHLCNGFRNHYCSQLNEQGTEASLQAYRIASEDSSTFEDVKSTLARFITYVLHHKAVLNNSKKIQQTLAYELETFLLAHVVQATDNRRFALQRGSQALVDSDFAPPSMPQKYSSLGRTFYNWVRSTSSDHTSCPFSFVFFNCLISNPGTSVFKTAKSAYLAEDLCRHLASLCRMYNDYGSIARDEEEGNLNSVNFPEFHSGIKDGRGNVQDIKDQLMWIAGYERDGLRSATAKLQEELEDRSLMDALKVFIDVTDLYGQIYVQRDITSKLATREVVVAKG